MSNFVSTFYYFLIFFRISKILINIHEYNFLLELAHDWTTIELYNIVKVIEK